MSMRRLISSVRSGDGTWVIGFGALAAAIGAYAFQVVGGRALGPEGFGPIAALWTVGFLLHTIVMLPVEQLITRTISFVAPGPLPVTTAREAGITLALGSVAGVALVAISLDRFFDDQPVFIGAMAILMASRATMTLGRGVLAGTRRFASYGLSLLLEAMILATLGVFIALSNGAAAWFGFALAIAPMAILIVRPFTVAEAETDDQLWQQSGSLLPLLVVAAGLSQLVLAAGPLVVGLVGGSAAEVSVFFITFTLLRGPVTASFGLSTRLLADLAAAASRGDTAKLRRWSLRLLTIGMIAAVASAAASYFVLPALIEFLYGLEFRPSATVAALGGGGALAALTLLFVSQVLIALGRTRDLATGWLAAVAIAGLVVAGSDADPVLRVAYAFAAGEASAFLAVSATAIWRSSRT